MLLNPLPKIPSAEPISPPGAQEILQSSWLVKCGDKKKCRLHSNILHNLR